jgi:hypothetical protein
MHAMWVTVATTLGSMPGALAFNHDMFLNVPLITHWQPTVQHHEQCVNSTFAEPT